MQIQIKPEDEMKIDMKLQIKRNTNKYKIKITQIRIKQNRT